MKLTDSTPSINYTISTCLVSSVEHTAYPNGNLKTKGIVDYFSNHGSNRYDPVKVSDIIVTNDNGVIFFNRKENTSVDTIRSIAKGLLEIAANAELAHKRMVELNAAK